MLQQSLNILTPTTITPNVGDATSMLTATASSTVQHYFRARLTGTLFASLGLFGCFFASARASRRRLYTLVLGGIASTLVLGSLLASTGCGGNYHANRGTASIVVTATSGALTHTTTISLTVQ